MTASETMIEVMSRFQKAEPLDVLIVWTDEEGGVSVKSNCTHTRTIGMAKYAEALAMNTLLEAPDPLDDVN
jgi:hypothetical protein